MESRIDLRVRTVSMEGRPSSSISGFRLRSFRSARCFLAFLDHRLSMACQIDPKNRELAFLNCRQVDTLSSCTLTLFQLCSLWTEALLSSMSKMVLR